MQINTENFNTKVIETKNGRTMILSQCDVCSSGKSRFIKKQEPSEILSSIGIRTTLSKTPVLGDIFFKLRFE